MWENLDVGGVVDALSAGGAEVLAGHQGLDREVRHARVAVDTAELRHAAAGELVVTTAEGLRTADSDIAHLLARLHAANVAGLAVRFERGETPLREALEAADQLGLTILGVPEATALEEVAASTLAALLDAHRSTTSRVMGIHERFTRIVLSGGGTAELATALYDLLGCTVAVLDGDGRPLAVVPADADLDNIALGLRQPVAAGGVTYGEIVALAEPDTLGEEARVALERAAMGIAVRLAQASAVAEAQERFAAITLEELISGHANLDDVLERAHSFGWDLQRPRAVLLASIDPPETGSTPTGPLGTIAAAARATLGPEAIVWTRSSTIAALVAPTDDRLGGRREVAERLRLELDAQVRSVTISIGVGTTVEHPGLLARSYVEASRAVDVGRWAKGRHVTELFDELGLERLLAAAPARDLAEFVEHSIGPLIAHDAEQRTDLVGTLSTWLETRNMAEAARRFHVHYNTLKNRLDRIEAIIGPVLTDPAFALECEVALYIHRQHGIP